METLNTCPICNASDYKTFLTCLDHTVSKSEFNIAQCQSCGFKFTNPRPRQSEIGEYYKSEEYVSHSNSKAGLVNKIYHIVRKYTLTKKLQLLLKLAGSRYKKDKLSILDIGCGTGAFLDICKQFDLNCVGIEPDETARNFAIQNYSLHVKQETEIDALQKESFDFITLWHVLEHVHNLGERISKIKELLKPHGWAIVAVPNCSSFDAKQYKKYWAAYDVPRHLYHFTPIDIEKVFNQHNMRVEKILPMRFDSYYVSILSEKYKTGKINYLKAMMIGLWSNVLAIKTGREFSSQIYIIKKSA